MTMRTWTAAAGALAGALLMSACSSTPEPTPTTSTAPAPSSSSTGSGTTSPSGSASVAPMTWGPCTGTPDSAYLAKAQCGTLSVPLDHTDPSGPHITLALSVVHHTVPDAQYQGAILLNPGGPGGSGLYTNRVGETFGKVGQQYDWVGFDPRGIGASTPALRCDSTYMDGARPPYLPATAAVTQTWLARAKKYAQDCRTKVGALLDHVKTIDTAWDMDYIRQSLGLDTISYYGFSYGTYLGQVYATLFPTHVRRMILDSNVDPQTVWYQGNLDQDVAVERNVGLFFSWVAKHDSTYSLGTTQAAVRRVYEAGLASLSAKPHGTVGGAEWADTFVLTAYNSGGWKTLADALAAWKRSGDTSTIKAVYQSLNPPGDDNSYAGYVAVQCTDVAWPTSWARWQRDNTAVAAKAPLYTWPNAWFNAPCLYWTAKPGTPVTVGTSASPPMLLVDETLDAPTPYSGSLEARTLFPRSVLLAEPGGVNHADSPDSTPCVVSTISAYLATGALPSRSPRADHADQTCPAPPLP
jgi:pimeloyl-ACP methyl ester carboxylesterase